MKQFKIFTLTLSTLFIPLFMWAQQNNGIDLINAEMYVAAKQYFNRQLSDSLAKPEACYYLGETYRLTNKLDSALFYYNMGISTISSNPLCMIGKAGLIMSNEPIVAMDMIKKAKSIKAYKKNPYLYIAIANAYFSNKKITEALEQIEIAKNVDKKNTSIYLNEGNILYKPEIAGSAVNKYETAIYYDANCKPAYLKVAKIYYLAKNYEQAEQYLDKLNAIDQHFAPVLKLVGDLNYDQGKYAKSVLAYAEYLQTSEAVLNDQIRYSYALFFNKEYEKSLAEIMKLIPLYPDNQVLKRIMAYNLYETGKFSDGLNQMTEFLAMADTSSIISNDYKYYARLLAKNNMDSISIINYNKAIATSDKPEEYYKEIATLYEKMKNYYEAANYYEQYLKSNETPVNSDYFFWGKDCYFAAAAIDSAAIAQDSTKADIQKQLFYKADSLFGGVAERAPTNHLGYLWRARVNSLIDPETEKGLAKPYYEKVIEILEQPDKNNKKELIEAYQYHGYYYYVKKDRENSRLYWSKILVVDPNHAVAKQALESKE